MAANGLLTDAAEEALRQVEECQTFHDDLVKTVEVRRRQFEGILERATEAARWQSQLHPPYINHIVETTIAGLIEDRLKYQVNPAPRFYNPGEFDVALQGAKAHEDLFAAQLKADHFNEFQRPYVLDAAVVGLGVAKTFWRNEVASRTRNVVKDIRTVNDDYAHLPVAVPTLVQETRAETVFDGPVTEAVDLRDLYWHEAAVSVEKSRWFAHAIWMSHDDLQKLAKKGVYDQAAVDQLDPKAANDTQKAGDTLERERERRGRNKDMFECLEIWNRETGRVITVGARKVVLRDKPWPFWHNDYPFVFTSLQPYPRSLRGMSIVEKLAHLQDATWDLLNQRIDTTRFVGNFIQILRSDVEDPDAFPFEPGAQWFMEDPTAVTQWAPDISVATASLAAESLLKQDMQNLAGGQPFTSTGEADQQGANTATEAALVTNLAQMAVKQMKTQLFYSYERIGCQRLYLNQQFIREPAYILDQIGLDSEPEVREIMPELLGGVGDYRFDVEPMAESLNQTQRRAEASSLFQVISSSQMVCASSGSPWNIKAAQQDLLESYDKQNTDRYLATPQPQQGQQAPPGQPGTPAVPGQQPVGITAPQSIDPATSPSAQASLSPAVFAQRNLATTGGVNNS